MDNIILKKIALNLYIIIRNYKMCYYTIIHEGEKYQRPRGEKSIYIIIILQQWS